MQPKSVIQIIIIFFLIIILYILGARINVNVKEVREIIEVLPPSPAPAPIFLDEEKTGILGPVGIITNKMIKNKNLYPHKNPMMYKKKKLNLLNNISE